MCGIVGLFAKSSLAEAELGLTMTTMLQALSCRGPDSSGVALMSQAAFDQWILRVKAGDTTDMSSEEIDRNIELIQAFVRASHLAEETVVSGCYVRFQVTQLSEPQSLERQLESLAPGIEVISIGRALELFKEVGSPDQLEERHQVASIAGTHGIGHTRLSTESKVDLSHSQPFWAHGTPDVAIAHNGHITNYHQLRRRYEQRGVRFHTENDSEILSLYVGEQIRQGASLKDALTGILDEMDGSFCCVAVTESEMGFAKDEFAFKPLVVADTPDFIAVSTEEVAIRKAIPGTFDVREAEAGEVRVWRQ
jgi:glutamine phosphoribosylpyrophosphate amidotransferase